MKLSEKDKKSLGRMIFHTWFGTRPELKKQEIRRIKEKIEVEKLQIKVLKRMLKDSK